MTSTRRRVLDGGLAAASVVVLLVFLLTLLDRGDMQHVALQRLYHPVLSLALGGALMLGACVRRGVPTGWRLAGVLAGGLALALAVPLGFLRLVFPPEHEVGVEASSPDYQVVAYRVSAGLTAPHRIRLVLRTREGLASRESDIEMACFQDNERGDPAADWFLGRVEFAAPHTVRFVAASGAGWTVDFDPVTLEPAGAVDQCPNVAP
ncbi:hypothetical protein [Actinoplanes sp. NPDC051411]|uniref:hypothetical protein n=1 Tax=Actinoplanes sp. NPDC051411 TaxID=3155522 RepID=UPI003441BF0A